MKRIALFFPNLSGGGVERVCILLAKEFLRRGHSVDFVLLQKKGVLLDQVPPDVAVVDLSASRIRNGFWPLMRYLKHYKPDVLLVSMWPLTTLAVLAAKVARYKGKVVVSEHNTLSRTRQAYGVSGRALRWSMRWVNGRSDVVIGVSRGVIDDLHGLGLPSAAGKRIYNPIAISSNIDIPEIWSGHPWLKLKLVNRILSVGSLKPQKDYPNLLRAMQRLKERGYPAELLILGTGPLEEELRTQRNSLGLSETVHFGGFVSDPGPFYRAAGLFVLSSAWEGFGNVIVEALAAGTPVVATDCVSGPAEILQNGKYGTLVPVGDDAALADSIEASLHSEHEPDLLRRRAEDFSPEQVAQRYLDIFFS